MGALELVLLALRVAVGLVRFVVALVLSVALHRAADALAVGASELGLGTVPGGAVELVRTVAAVVVVVAVPPAGDAFVVLATEVGRLARVELRLAAGGRLVFVLAAVRVAVAFPREWNAPR